MANKGIEFEVGGIVPTEQQAPKKRISYNELFTRIQDSRARRGLPTLTIEEHLVELIRTKRYEAWKRGLDATVRF